MTADMTPTDRLTALITLAAAKGHRLYRRCYEGLLR